MFPDAGPIVAAEVSWLVDSHVEVEFPPGDVGVGAVAVKEEPPVNTDRKRGGLICEGEGFVAVGINNLPGLA